MALNTDTVPASCCLMCGHASLNSEFPAPPPLQSGIASFAADQTQPADRPACSQRPGRFLHLIWDFFSPLINGVSTWGHRKCPFLMALWERVFEHSSLPFAMTCPGADGCSPRRLVRTGHGVKSAFPLPPLPPRDCPRGGGLPRPGGAELSLAATASPSRRGGTRAPLATDPRRLRGRPRARRARPLFAAGRPAGARPVPAVAKLCSTTPSYTHPAPPSSPGRQRSNERRGRLPRWPMRGRRRGGGGSCHREGERRRLCFAVLDCSLVRSLLAARSLRARSRPLVLLPVAAEQLTCFLLLGPCVSAAAGLEHC